MSESLALAARLAANLFVDAIKLAKPGARLAAKVGDRLLDGSPFNEREAQRFLTSDGAERLAEAEAERDAYEPDPLWSAARVRELDDDAKAERAHQTMASVCQAIDGLLSENPVYQKLQAAHEFNTIPNWPQSSAPVDRKPADADSPESTPAPPLPGVGSGSLTKEEWARLLGHASAVPTTEQPVHAGVTGPGMDVVAAFEPERIAGMTRHDLRIMLGAASAALKIVERVHPEDDYWAHLGLQLREASDALK